MLHATKIFSVIARPSFRLSSYYGSSSLQSLYDAFHHPTTATVVMSLLHSKLCTKYYHLNYIYLIPTLCSSISHDFISLCFTSSHTIETRSAAYQCSSLLNESIIISSLNNIFFRTHLIFTNTGIFHP